MPLRKSLAALLLVPVLLVLGLRAAVAATAAPTKFSPAGAKVASLTVEAASGQAASLVLLSKDKPAYTMQADKAGTFSIRQGDSDIVTISETGDLVARTHMLAAGALSAGTGVYVRDTMQWALVVDEEFSSGQSGWEFVGGGSSGTAKVPTSQCRGGLFMLGGFEGLAKSAVQKTWTGSFRRRFFTMGVYVLAFAEIWGLLRTLPHPTCSCSCVRNRGSVGLPKHTKLRVTATFHFIDAWNGETAFMKLNQGAPGKENLEYVWTERYDVSDYRGMIDVCGSALGEGRFASPIDVSMVRFYTRVWLTVWLFVLTLTDCAELAVTVPIRLPSCTAVRQAHTGDSVSVQFGTTLNLPAAASKGFYGISSVQLYVRS